VAINIGGLREGVSIIGVGYTPFGNVLETPEIKDMTERELFAFAALEAMEDAGIEAKDIDAFYFGHAMGETLSHQTAGSAAVADWIGMRNKPGFRHDTACASTNAGLGYAATDIASGVRRVVLSGGVEITGSRPKEGKPPHIREPMIPEELWFRTNYGADQAYWYPSGLAPAYMLDLAVIAYGKKYGLTLEQLDDALNAASISNRRNGVRNPKATTFKKEFAEEAKEHGFGDVNEYLKSRFNPKIGAIARMYHLAIPVDGASALILCPASMAKGLTDHPIDVIGFGSTANVYYHEAELPWQLDQGAFAQAYEMAKINPHKDVDYMSIHDCMGLQFTSGEAAGYFHPGEGWRVIMEGRTAFDGDRPLSTTGGRTVMGHAWSASAGAEIAEAVRQMRGLCGTRQIKPVPEVSVIHNIGHGAHCSVCVLRTRS